MKYITTSYLGPDMDGASCMYAYTEYLRRIGKEAFYYVEGALKREVQVVCELFDISFESILKEEADNNKYIIVDTNLYSDIPSFIKREDIVEIIDHHINIEPLEQYTNAKIHIEFVGAAATLVVEKFIQDHVEMSMESATLLYYGIISNTVNLKSSVTTKRDIEAIRWLENKGVDTYHIKEVFDSKSKITDNLREEMEVEIPCYIKNNNFIIGQLELTEAEKFLQNNTNKIEKILKEVKEEKKADYLFLNVIDIYEGHTILLVQDETTAEFLTKLLGKEIYIGNNQIENMIMRKQLLQKIQEFTK